MSINLSWVGNTGCSSHEEASHENCERIFKVLFAALSVHRMGCDFKARLVRFWDEGLGLSFPQA